MNERVVRRALAVSFLGHLVFFSIINFSFGARITRPDFGGIFFVGGLLRAANVCAPFLPRATFDRRFARNPAAWLLPAAAQDAAFPVEFFIKPASGPVDARLKPSFEAGFAQDAAVPKRKESVVMFYPRLPYHFLLYFKDRQSAHLELQFLISSYEQSNAVTIRRKISSGNLEVDLLSMRYLDHYLSMQMARFPLNQWQTVKIDFKPKNE